MAVQYVDTAVLPVDDISVDVTNVDNVDTVDVTKVDNVEDNVESTTVVFAVSNSSEPVGNVEIIIPDVGRDELVDVVI